MAQGRHITVRKYFSVELSNFDNSVVISFSQLKNSNKMKDFLLVFRSENRSGKTPPSPEEMQASMKLWMDWLGGIAAQNKLADHGNPLQPSGKVLHPNNVVTDGPYSEIKESIGGYSIVKAASLDEAIELAKGCPVLAVGGNVEVREVLAM